MVNIKKHTKILTFVILLFSMISFSYSYYEPVTNFNDDEFPLVVIPKINGTIQPYTEFTYQFVFTEDNSCNDVVYSTTQFLTTDRYGASSTTVNLSSINDIPSYLCEYRDGDLRKIHPLNERLFMKQITEQDIIDYGFIKNYTNTQLNDTDISNYGYIKNFTETDPTLTLQKLQNLTNNDFHNLGGTDRVLNKSEIKQLGFLLNETDYCRNGVCDGDLKITGDLVLIGTLTNVNATNVNANGSIVPDFGDVFDLGNVTNKWDTIYANEIYGTINFSQIQNVPNYLLSENDPTISSTTNNKWCRGTGTNIVCDVTPFVDTFLTDSDISNLGYIKSYTETDPIFQSSDVYGVTSNDISNWNNAYSWGNHQNYGYITDANDLVNSDELDNICNMNNMTLKRVNGTWGCSTQSSFIPSTLLQDYNFVDNSQDWNQVYQDYYNNSQGYLTNYTETDPVYINDKNSIVFFSNTTNWDKDTSDDFSGNWNDLISIPSGFLDGIDNDTTYDNLSEFNNDVGYLTSYTETDPIFQSSDVYGINSSNITNWNTAYSWGNHNIQGYLTNYTETDPIFTNSPSFSITNGDISNWENTYNDYYNNTQGYLTSFNESDPIYVSERSGIVFYVDTNNWDKNASDDFSGNWNDLVGVPLGFIDGVDNDTTYDNLSEFNNDVGFITNFSETDPIFTSSDVFNVSLVDISNWNEVYLDYYNNTQGYLTNYTETDPIWNNEKSDYVLISSTSNWDKNASDDFDGNYNNLFNTPNNLSQFNNDVGYITSYVNTQLNESQVDNFVSNNGYVLISNTTNWDKNANDDFDYQWSSLLNVPLGFLDGIDNDTTYDNLSEFNNDVGYLTSFNESDPIFINSPSFSITNGNITNWNTAYSWGNHNIQGYLTNYTETDPIFTSSDVFNVSQSMIDNWNEVYNQINNGQNSSVVFLDDTTNWDKNASDDFDGNWSSLTNIPNGFLDGIDNDTTYDNLSEFNNDVGYITNNSNVTFNSIDVNGNEVCLETGNCVNQNENSVDNHQYVNIKDDFIGYSLEDGELGELGWRKRDESDGVTIYSPNNYLSNPFVITCSVKGDNDKSGCIWSLGDSYVLSGNESIGFVINTETKLDSRKAFGLFNYFNKPENYGNIDNGVYFEITDFDSNIIGISESNGNRQTCDTGVQAIDNTWFDTRIEVKEDMSGVDYYVNDVYRCSVNNNIPSQSIGPSVYSVKLKKTNFDLLSIDLFYMNYKIDGNRYD